MGRYERELRQVQVRKLLSERKYDEALKMTEQVLENRTVKDISELEIYAEVYKCNKMYDKAKELYYMIYDEIHTRRVLYKLLNFYIKAGNLEESEELYEEYLEKDKDSIDRYILRYRLDKASGADRHILIKDLQNIKKAEYMEDWGYELAKQYHKAGMVKECIAECNDLILWFGEGEIVERAKLLKMHYEGGIDNEVVRKLQSYIKSDVNNYMVESVMEENEVDKEFQTQIKLPIPSDNEPVNQTGDNTEAATADYYEHNATETTTGVEAEADTNDNVSTNTNTDTNTNANTSANTSAVENTEADISETHMSETNKNVSAFGRYVDYVTKKELFEKPECFTKGQLSFAIATAEDNKDATSMVQLIAKAIRKIGRFENTTILRIDAKKLNGVTLDPLKMDLLSKCIMIEDASAMSSKTINGIIKILDAYPGQIAFFFTDTEDNLSKMLFKEEILKNQIKYFVLTD